MQANACCPDKPYTLGFMQLNGLRWNQCFGCNQAYHVDDLTRKLTRVEITAFYPKP